MPSISPSTHTGWEVVYEGWLKKRRTSAPRINQKRFFRIIRTPSVVLEHILEYYGKPPSEGGSSHGTCELHYGIEWKESSEDRSVFNFKGFQPHNGRTKTFNLTADNPASAAQWRRMLDMASTPANLEPSGATMDTQTSNVKAAAPALTSPPLLVTRNSSSVSSLDSYMSAASTTVAVSHVQHDSVASMGSASPCESPKAEAPPMSVEESDPEPFLPSVDTAAQMAAASPPDKISGDASEYWSCDSKLNTLATPNVDEAAANPTVDGWVWSFWSAMDVPEWYTSKDAASNKSDDPKRALDFTNDKALVESTSVLRPAGTTTNIPPTPASTKYTATSTRPRSSCCLGLDCQSSWSNLWKV